MGQPASHQHSTLYIAKETGIESQRAPLLFNGIECASRTTVDGPPALLFGTVTSNVPSLPQVEPVGSDLDPAAGRAPDAWEKVGDGGAGDFLCLARNPAVVSAQVRVPGVPHFELR